MGGLWFSCFVVDFLSFRKCQENVVLLYDGESCRTNYDARKTRPFYGGAVFKFPDDLDELKLLEQSLANKLPTKFKRPDVKLSKTIGIYYKHFPADCPTKKQPGGSRAPTVPPSIFGNTRSSLFVQTQSAITPREPDKRNVIAELKVLNDSAREYALDVVDSFSNILK